MSYMESTKAYELRLGTKKGSYVVWSNITHRVLETFWTCDECQKAVYDYNGDHYIDQLEAQV